VFGLRTREISYHVFEAVRPLGQLIDRPVKASVSMTCIFCMIAASKTADTLSLTSADTTDPSSCVISRLRCACLILLMKSEKCWHRCITPDHVDRHSDACDCYTAVPKSEVEPERGPPVVFTSCAWTAKQLCQPVKT